MPNYEYTCTACGNFETYQKFSDPSLTHCPTCTKEVKKVFSVPSMSGFKTAPSTATHIDRPDRSAAWNSAQRE